MSSEVSVARRGVVARRTLLLLDLGVHDADVARKAACSAHHLVAHGTCALGGA